MSQAIARLNLRRLTICAPVNYGHASVTVQRTGPPQMPRDLPSEQRNARLLRCARAVTVLGVLSASGATAAAQDHLGKPLIYNFSSRDVGGEVQHWDALQDHRGVMYFANNGGVLEYDGHTWRLIELPSRVGVRSITMAPDGHGRIYVGAIGDFGYLDADAAGQLRFFSLLPPEAKGDPSFDQIFTPVMAPTGGVYFQGKTKLCHFDVTLQCLETDASLSMIFAADGKLYVQQKAVGLMELVDGSVRAIPGGDRFATDDITVVLSLPHVGGKAVLIGTRDFRFFIHRERGFEPFPIAARDNHGNDQLLGGAVLRDGSVAFGTLLRGVVIVDPAGHVLQQIDQSIGLQGNHVHAVLPDRQGGVWVALQNGVSRIDVSSPFSIFDEGSGLEREWREVIGHDGMLYVRGYKGLFAARLPAAQPGSVPSVPSRRLQFQRVVQIDPPAAAFVATANRLLVASHHGVHEVRGMRAREIITYRARPLTLHRSRHDPNRVYVGLDEGVASIRLRDGMWRDEGLIDGIDESITSIGEGDNGDLWLVSQRQRVIRVMPDRTIRAYPLGSQALTGRISIREVAGRTLFLTDTWILEFDTASDRFVPFSKMQALAGMDRRSFSWVAEDPHGNIWIASRKPGGIDVLHKQADGTYVADNAGLRQTLTWSIYPEPQGSVVWLCTPDYLMRYDRSILANASAHFATLLRKVTARNGTVVYGGAPVPPRNDARTGDAPYLQPVFPYDANSLQFEFAAPRFDDAGRNEFQSYLEGFDEEWSAWSAAFTRSYTNLPKGRYRFHVRSRDIEGRVGQAAVFGFAIRAPWYQTGWAYGLYGVLVCGFLFVISKYERRRAHLRLEHRLEHVELEKLRDLDRMKSRFFADISHEFRTPLTLILGPVGQMLEEAQSPDLVNRLRLVRRNAQYLLRLISQLLDLSKLESGKMRLHATRGNLVHGLEPIIAPFGAIAEQHGIGLTFPDGRARVLEGTEIYFDSDVLQKILNNLLGNAFKFTPAGGTVSVEVRRQGEFAEIVVSDTGVGISHEHLPHVFDRFYQVDGSRAREGIGIGLALVRELVELHHGEISVESEEGRGTTFVVRLRTGSSHLAPEEIVANAALTPRETEARPTPEIHVDVEGPQEAAGVRQPDEEAIEETTVLIVEDHAEVRKFLRDHLQKYYRVIEAQDGFEGLEKATASVPDLVLSDVMMPQMDGYEFCKALKTNESTCHIPVVLLTAKATREDKLHGLDMGADCYLIKPFDALELLMQVRNLIDQRCRLRERFSGPVVLKPTEIGVTPMDQAFLTKVLTVVQDNLQDPSFDVERLGREVGLSRSQLHRKLRALTNQPPTLMIRSIRLQRAAELLSHKTGSVAEIAYFVGFNSQAYFAKCFREQFGCSPKEYALTTPVSGQSGATIEAGGDTAPSRKPPVPFRPRPVRRGA